MSTTNTTPIPILIIGLGRFAPHHPQVPNDLKQKFATEMARVQAAGYETTALQLNPDDIPKSLREVKESLEGKEFKAVVIGYGLRGLKEYTVLFEGVMGCVMERGVKLLFTEAPDGIMEALGRL